MDNKQFEELKEHNRKLVEANHPFKKVQEKKESMVHWLGLPPGEILLAYLRESCEMYKFILIHANITQHGDASDTLRGKIVILEELINLKGTLENLKKAESNGKGA